MELAAAVATVRPHTMPKHELYALIRVRTGFVDAFGLAGGATIPCNVDLGDKEVYVDPERLAKMLAQAGSAAKLRVTKATLHVEGTVSFQLKCATSGWGGLQPERPAAGWSAVSPEQLAAVTAVGLMASKDEDLTGTVRWTPDWVATTRGASLCLAWVTGLVQQPVTFAAGVLRGLSGDVQVASVGNLFWIDAGDNGLRWCRLVDAPWADASVNQLIGRVRQPEGRVVVPIDLGELAALVKACGVASDSPADVGVLEMGDNRLRLTLSGQTGSFDGGVGAVGSFPGLRVGIECGRFEQALRIVARATKDQQYLSVGGPTEPVLMYGLSPVAVESIVMPAYLPTVA